MEAKDPLQEIIRYQEKALRAAALGNKETARCWRLAADEASHFLQQQKIALLFFPNTIPFAAEIAHLIYSNEEAHYHLDRHLQKSTAPHWAFAKDETKEAGAAYRYWIALTRTGISKNFEQEIKQTIEAISHNNVPSRAVHFLEQALLFFQKAQQHQEQCLQQRSLQDGFIIHRWKRAAYEALSLACLYGKNIASEANEDSLFRHYWNSWSSHAEQSLALRIKAAEATQNNAEEEAIQYSLAAYAIASATENLLNINTRLETDFQKETFPIFSKLAQKIVRYRTKSSTLFSYNAQSAILWDQAACWLETAWNLQLKAVEAKEKKQPLLFFHWKKARKSAEQVATFFEKNARTASLVPSLLSKHEKKIAAYFETRARKKIPILFLEKITFCLTEHLLPTQAWREKWESGEPIHFDAHSKSPMVTSWIYQTWSFLNKAGIECQLSTQFPSMMSEGIFITMTKLLTPVITRPPSFSAPFLVDILADGPPHPDTNLHLVENRRHAPYLFNSIFVPHWPQPFLIPRNPARGTHFENIGFFGEIQNLAPELRSAEWQQRLQKELGLHFKIRQPQEWNDYSDIDCSIAIRDFSKSSHLNKPATKLYNSWLAGVPFIGGRDIAYAADGDLGKNYLRATSLEELFQHLKYLKENISSRTMLVQHGLQSSEAFTKEATLEYWKKLIQEIIPARAFQWQQFSTPHRAFLFFIQRIICGLHQFYFKKNGL